MIRNKVLLCLLGISACFVAGTVARLEGEGIIGGDKANVNQFPYQISLQIYGQSICGGGIIADQFVLTAAHCVVNRDGQFSARRLSVVAGTNNLRNTRNTVTAEVAKIYVPTGYEPQYGSTVNDIAVLKLKTPLGLSSHSNIRSLDLPNNPRKTYADETVVISGFGWDWVVVDYNNQETGGRSDTELRFAEADVLTTRSCQQSYSRPISEKQICAQTKQRFIYKPSGVCSGDSGGPLVHGGNTIVGVVSTSPIGCTEKVAAAVYTRVSSYLDFIQNAMEDKESSDIRTLELIPTFTFRPTSRPFFSGNVGSRPSRPSFNDFDDVGVSSQPKPQKPSSPSIWNRFFGSWWG